MNISEMYSTQPLMRVSFYIILTLFVCSCGKKEQKTNQSTENLKLFQEVLEHYGGKDVFKSTITYSSGAFDYLIERDDYRVKVTISRIHKDSTTYTTVYEFGTITEYIDGIEQPKRTTSNTLIISNIEGFVYSNSIPHVLTANDIEITPLKDVNLYSNTYSVLYAKTKYVEGIDISHFYLYIDDNTKDIMFLAQDFITEGKEPQFKRFYNHRTVNGIRFADYTSFVRKQDTIALSNMIKYFNADYFKPLKEVTFTDISVSYPEKILE